jgi:hypothetical protein
MHLGRTPSVIASGAKQSILRRWLDCFVAIARRKTGVLSNALSLLAMTIPLICNLRQDQAIAPDLERWPARSMSNSMRRRIAAGYVPVAHANRNDSRVFRLSQSIVDFSDSVHLVRDGGYLRGNFPIRTLRRSLPLGSRYRRAAFQKNRASKLQTGGCCQAVRYV